MKKKALVVLALSIALGTLFNLFAVPAASTDPSPQGIAGQIIAREKGSFEAWKKKDKAYFADLLADDATYFGAMHPYLDTDPKENFLPKFEQYAETFKFVDYQMYHPRVQIYGDTAVLTYNSAISATMGGQPINYTAKVSVVYVKQGNTWRVVHGHESMNPSAK